MQVLTPKEATGAVLLGIVKGETLLQLGLGRVQFTEEEQGVPQDYLGICEVHGVLDTLG